MKSPRCLILCSPRRPQEAIRPWKVQARPCEPIRVAFRSFPEIHMEPFQTNRSKGCSKRVPGRDPEEHGISKVPAIQVGLQTFVAPGAKDRDRSQIMARGASLGRQSDMAVLWQVVSGVVLFLATPFSILCGRFWLLDPHMQGSGPEPNPMVLRDPRVERLGGLEMIHGIQRPRRRSYSSQRGRLPLPCLAGACSPLFFASGDFRYVFFGESSPSSAPSSDCLVNVCSLS